MSHDPNAFDGTWRPDPQRPGPERDPDVLALADGFFACESCQPPYRVPADGREHPVAGQPGFDTIVVVAVDDRTVHLVGRRDGAVVLDSTTVVAADGERKAETRTVTGIAPRPVVIAIESIRVGGPVVGGHAISGTWRVVELDLVNHEEDTIYRIADGTLTMSDGFGRSFTARLDGTIAPYHGDARFDAVSVTRIDERTIEEADRLGDAIVFIARWHVEPDGETMSVRFDDTHGHVTEQRGRRLR